MLGAREQVKLEPATRQALWTNISTSEPAPCDFAIPAMRPVARSKVPVMRVAAIDLGKVRVGIAVSDELGMLAHPRRFLPGGSRKGLLDALAQLATQEGIERFLVGLPRQLDGSEGRPAREARQFAQALGQRTGVAVELCDEWLSTRQAHQRLQEGGHSARDRRERVDSAAAAVLLQSWLDARPAGAG
jgi:putative Holliday junction resolvase